MSEFLNSSARSHCRLSLLCFCLLSTASLPFGCSRPASDVRPQAVVAPVVAEQPDCADDWYYDQDRTTRLPLPGTVREFYPEQFLFRLKSNVSLGAVPFTGDLICVDEGPVPGVLKATSRNAICDANRLVETGLVEWAQPNFTRELELREGSSAGTPN